MHGATSGRRAADGAETAIAGGGADVDAPEPAEVPRVHVGGRVRGMAARRAVSATSVRMPLTAYVPGVILAAWPGKSVFHPDFDPEVDALAPEVQDELLAHAKLLEAFGPTLGRPRADTLKGSRRANMKELRFTADGGVWRIAFAFDPERKAVLLVAADKSGVGQRRLYRRLIGKADERFDQHLDRLKAARRTR